MFISKKGTICLCCDMDDPVVGQIVSLLILYPVSTVVFVVLQCGVENCTACLHAEHVICFMFCRHFICSASMVPSLEMSCSL